MSEERERVEYKVVSEESERFREYRVVSERVRSPKLGLLKGSKGAPRYSVGCSGKKFG